MMWHEWMLLLNTMLMAFVIHRQIIIGDRLRLLLDLCKELVEAQRILSEAEVESHAGILAVLREIRDKMGR